jgi:translation elongation factor EF-Tu-like GTPase
MTDRHLEVELTFLAPDRGGRAQPPEMVGYRPHVRVPPGDELLGVEFLAHEGVAAAGHPVRAIVSLLYAPSVSYEALQPGARFEIVEGARVVGHGCVVSQRVPARIAI